jgi:dienelactone hydrolase
MSIRGLAGSLVVAMTVAVAHASAGEFVEIGTGTGTRAEPVRLVGYMARPLGAGPFSAVVLLHGCGGFHSSMISWADRLARFGYAALAVDTFGPRGIDDHCAGLSMDQVEDAYAALRFLTIKPFVRASHVAVMGFSMGGLSVLAALEKGFMEQRYAEKFRAGVAFYPVCQFASGITTAPVLVLIGEADDWTPSSACEAMVAGRPEVGASRTPGDRLSLELVIYPGAHHGFDEVELSVVPTRGITFKGHRLEYNEEAMKNSIVRVRRFLQRTIAVE